MGPKLFAFHKGETQYTLRLFPIGGYCKMPGKMAKVNIPTALTKVGTPADAGGSRRCAIQFYFCNFTVYCSLYGFRERLLTRPDR